MTDRPAMSNPAEMRARAERVRTTIAQRAARLRREAARTISGRAAGVPRLPSWSLAAAAGALAGLIAAFQRRRSKP